MNENSVGTTNNHYRFYRHINNILKDDEKVKSNFIEILKPIEGEQFPSGDIKAEIKGQGLLIGTSLVDYSELKFDTNNKGKVEIFNFFQNSLNFDYSYGNVIIPGSTVKGFFKNALEHNLMKLDIKNEVNLDLNKKNQIIDFLFEEGNIIYHDALIEPLEINQRKYLYGKDYITPLKDIKKNQISKEANPITIIKVLPGCKIDFFIKEKHNIDYNNSPFKNKEDILCLFKFIINNFEIGAKKNTGYGVMNVCDEAKI